MARGRGMQWRKARVHNVEGARSGDADDRDSGNAWRRCHCGDCVAVIHYRASANAALWEVFFLFLVDRRQGAAARHDDDAPLAAESGALRRNVALCRKRQVNDAPL